MSEKRKLPFPNVRVDVYGHGGAHVFVDGKEIGWGCEGFQLKCYKNEYGDYENKLELKLDAKAVILKDVPDYMIENERECEHEGFGCPKAAVSVK